MARERLKPEDYGDKQCACGCGQFLPLTAERAGRAFLYGHKPGAHVRTRRTALHAGRAPAPRTTALVNWRSLEEFVRADVAVKREQLRVRRERAAQVSAEWTTLNQEIATLEHQCEEEEAALELLLAGKGEPIGQN